jgi:hypothetical protein
VDPIELNRQHEFSGATVTAHDSKSCQLNHSLIHVQAVIKRRYGFTAFSNAEGIHTVFFVDFRKLLVHCSTVMTAKKPQPSPTGQPMSSELAELQVSINFLKEVDRD